MASRQRRSKVWLYFTRKDDHRATCNACKTSISSKGGNTTNMQKHLSTQHAITLQECHVFDALRTEANSSAANVSVSASPVNIEGKLHQTLSIVLAPFVSLCKPAMNNLHFHPFNLDDDVQSQTGSEAGSRSGSEAAASSSCAPLAPPFTEAGKSKMTEARVNECHRAVTKFVVKGLHPFTTVDAPDFR